jgi:dTMP kinase
MGSVSSDPPPQQPLRQYTPRLRTDFHMTIPPRRHSCDRGPLISIEGIPGVGKTYLTGHAAGGLDGNPLVLDGFSQREQGCPDLGKALLHALREASGRDPHLRSGAPAAEALLLLAIKRHDLDIVLPELSGGRIVVEGRSVDTTAVCQAVQLHPGAPAAALNEAVALVRLAASFRPLPDLTILITDDASAAIARAQRRDNRRFTPDQVAFMRETCTLHEQLAATDPLRYRVVDRRSTDSHQAVRQIRTWIGEARHGLSCVREPWQNPGSCCMYCGHHMEALPQ